MEKTEERSYREWLKRRAGRGSYASIISELAAEDSPSFKHYVRMDFNSFRRLAEIISPRIAKSATKMQSPISVPERRGYYTKILDNGRDVSFAGVPVSRV